MKSVKMNNCCEQFKIVLYSAGLSILAREKHEVFNFHVCTVHQ